MKTLSDNSLMLGVKAGDLDKMGLLFERYHRPLFAFLYHSTRQASHSEDLVQTVFYRMLKYRNAFSGEGEFRTWMYHVARNVLLDAAKKNQRVVYQADISIIGEKYAFENASDHQIHKQEDEENLHEALKILSPEHREVLLLSRFQELPYQEIAKILNTSEGNIKVKVHRAMKELRTVFMSLENEKNNL